jgi:hypothetical protein
LPEAVLRKQAPDRFHFISGKSRHFGVAALALLSPGDLEENHRFFNGFAHIQVEPSTIS